jgi:uncharacterized protein (AIM24 family)
MNAMHEVDYQIHGDDMQFVEIELDPQEAAVAEAGGMMYMDDGIEMETIFGDVAQKDSFLAAAKGVSVGIAFNKKIGTGLFGGEGFIMQRLTGDGWAFLHAGGTIHQRDLGPGETLRVDTGCVVAFLAHVGFDIKYVGGIKSALFGGEGLFFATLRGPGRVWLQSLPLSRLADRIYAAAPKAGGKSKGEGSVLGGLGRLLDGDN